MHAWRAGSAFRPAGWILAQMLKSALSLEARHEFCYPHRRRNKEPPKDGGLFFFRKSLPETQAGLPSVLLCVISSCVQWRFSSRAARENAVPDSGTHPPCRTAWTSDLPAVGALWI